MMRETASPIRREINRLGIKEMAVRPKNIRQPVAQLLRIQKTLIEKPGQGPLVIVTKELKYITTQVVYAVG